MATGWPTTQPPGAIKILVMFRPKLARAREERRDGARLKTHLAGALFLHGLGERTREPLEAETGLGSLILKGDRGSAELRRSKVGPHFRHSPSLFLSSTFGQRECSRDERTKMMCK